MTIINSPAKLNLCLHVTGKTAHGYHQLESLIVPIDLCDRITVEPSSELRVSFVGEFAANIIGDNIISKAIDQFETHSGVTIDPLAITVEKRIPVGAGMGGGSSNAAAILCELRNCYAPDMSEDELVALAVLIGADVPFFLHATPALMTGIGEVLTAIPDFPSIPAIIINPLQGVSTEAVFKRGFSVLTEAGMAVEHIPISLQELWSFLTHCHNDLTYNALKELPEISEVLTVLQALPEVRFVQMSGSGATCFALFESDAARERAMRRLTKKQKRWWIEAVTVHAKKV